MSETLRERLDQAIQAAGPVRVEHEGRGVEVDVCDADRLGVVVDRVRLTGGCRGLSEQAERVARQVRPDGERLVGVELDVGLGGATLRSDPQDMSGGRFFEVNIDAEGAEIRRFSVAPDGSRSPEGFSLTRGQLGRLVDDLSDSL